MYFLVKIFLVSFVFNLKNYYFIIYKGFAKFSWYRKCRKEIPESRRRVQVG